MRLLPDMRNEPEAARIAVTQGEQMLGVLALELRADLPVHPTLQVRHEHSLPWLPVPQLECRSITTRAWPKVSAEHARRFRGIYPYTERRHAHR